MQHKYSKITQKGIQIRRSKNNITAVKTQRYKLSIGTNIINPEKKTSIS
jgi:hypothetical protein